MRLTSPTYDGVYTRRETVIPAFSHNPQVLRAPDGSVALYAIGNGSFPITRLCRNCRDGVSAPGAPKGSQGCAAAADEAHEFDQQGVHVWTAPTVAGPFRLTGRLGMEPLFDNVAPLILPNGSAIIMWRGSLPETVGCEALGTSPHYALGPFSANEDTPLFKPNTQYTVPPEPCLSDPLYKKPCRQANIE